MPFKRESKTFFQRLINLRPNMWTPDTYYLLIGTLCRAPSIHHSKPTLLLFPPCSGPWRLTWSSSRGGLLNSANRRPSWEIREWRESSHSISLPSFLPAGLPRWCVPLLKSTAPFLGSLRPMGGNGSLLLLAWSNVLSLTVSLNPDYTSVKSPCIKFFSNFLTWPCCMFPLGLRLILGINDLFSIPSATSCLNLCNLPA